MGLGKEGAASAALFDPHLSSWRPYELAEGETVAGAVLRLPAAGTFNGSRLFVRTEHGTLAVRATAKSGHRRWPTCSNGPTSVPATGSL
jgi:hypothetical protein